MSTFFELRRKFLASVNNLIPITFTSSSDSKPYDGMYLSNDTVTTTGSLEEGDLVTFDVTGKQTLVGSSSNSFTYTLSPSTSDSKYDITKVEGTLTVTDDDVASDLVINIIPPNGTYNYGETVDFSVIVYNIYDVPKTITLSTSYDVTLQSSVFPNVPAGDSAQTYASYTVTDSDIVAGGATIQITASINNGISKTNTGTAQTASMNSSLNVTKVCTSTPVNNESYDLDEEVTYRITVENNGNLTITGIDVVDELAGVSFTIVSLSPGNSEVREVSHTVTESDIIDGTVRNEVVAQGISPDEDNPEVSGSGESLEPTVDALAYLVMEVAITSTPANEEYYVEDEIVDIDISVTNWGNLTIDNVVFWSGETGDEWTLPNPLPPGGRTSRSTTYTVTADDVANGSVVITAECSGDTPDPEFELEVEPGSAEEPAGSGLPYDAQVEYLESSGTQFIKTNINGNVRIIGCAQSSSIKGSSATLISSSNLGNRGCWYGEVLSTTKWGIGVEEGNYSNVLSTTKATFDIDFGATEITGTVNSESISRTIQADRSEWSIFACSTGNYAFSGKVFFIKIYKDNILVRDFIPVRVGNVGYLFDNVSKKLFGNAGTGNFTLGPDIVPIEYLESTGTQYIDTGVNLKLDDYFEIELCNTTNNFVENKGYGSGDNSSTLSKEISGGLRYYNNSIGTYICGKNIIYPNIENVTIGKWFKEYFTFSTPIVYNWYDFSEDSLYQSNPTSMTLSENLNNIYLFKSSSPSYSYAGKKRIRHVKIVRNNIPVLDLVPVRVGTVGYMYDKVSRKLFANAGAGGFILGNDI